MDRACTSCSPATTGAGDPEPLRLMLFSDPAGIAPARRAIEAFALDAGLTENDSADLGLVVNEALANVIRHAYKSRPGQPIELWADRSARGVCVRIRDWGDGVDPRQAKKRDYVPGEPGGLGLVCLGEMVDCCQFTPQPDGMLLELTKHRTDGQNESPVRQESQRNESDPGEPRRES